jgi:protein-disulfide isomerase
MSGNAGRTAVQAGLCLILFCSALLATRSEVVEGNPASPVRVVIYEDLQGPDCDRLRAMLDEKILPRYGSRVAFVHRDFPQGRHDWARQAAMAARWVSSQDSELGIVFRRELMSEQEHMTGAKLKTWLMDFAARNHLDQKGIVESLTAPQFGAMVDQDYQAGQARGVTSTPTVFVGGQKLTERILYEDFARALDVELGH